MNLLRKSSARIEYISQIKCIGACKSEPCYTKHKIYFCFGRVLHDLLRVNKVSFFIHYSCDTDSQEFYIFLAKALELITFSSCSHSIKLL